MPRVILSSWMRMRRKNTTGRVGEFYARLIQSVVGGTAGSSFDNGSDILNHQLGFEVEVKASSNNQHFRISSSQKLRYLEKTPFPLDCFLYALCSYRGKGSDKRSRLSRCRTKAELFGVLAERTDEVYLFDIEILNAFERKLGVLTGRYVGNGAKEEVFTMQRKRDIRLFWNGRRLESMNSLGLRSSDWTFGSVELEENLSVGGRIYAASFTLFTALRPSIHRKLFKTREFPPNQYRHRGVK